MMTLDEREKHILECLDAGAYKDSDRGAKARYAEAGARFDDLRAQILSNGDAPTDEQLESLRAVASDVKGADDVLGVEDPHFHAYVDSEPAGRDWGNIEGVTFPRSGGLLGLAAEDFLDTTWDHTWRYTI